MTYLGGEGTGYGIGEQAAVYRFGLDRPAFRFRP